MGAKGIKTIDVIRCHGDDLGADLQQAAERVSEYMTMLLKHLKKFGCTKEFPTSFKGDLPDALIEVIQGIARAQAVMAITESVSNFKSLPKS